ncbi:odorant receptor 88a [Calliphora vicina]|uniref:odorant receptor 88a n=1 Tax=Calliphora vicina TaxID=7373 RepID=UPI00325A5207
MTEPERLFTLDEFLLKMQISQKYTRVIYLDFRRDNETQPFRFKTIKFLYVAISLMVIDCICNIMKIIIEISSNRLSEAKQIGAVFSIEFLCLVRGVSVLAKYNRILDLTNCLDKIFPRNLELQRRMNIMKLVRYLAIRHRILHVYAIVGLTAFIGLPLLKYLVFYDRSSGLPLLDEYHQHASWFPYQLKQSNRAYPYMYVYETFITIFGINCLFTWDHIYTVTVAQFVMHFDYINDQLEELDAKKTLEDSSSKQFYSSLRDIVIYHQHIYELGDKLRKTFNLSLFLTDIVSAASICFHIYLMANSDDILAIILFIFPCFVQVAFTFDNCYQGTRVAEASARMQMALFEQNWYDGSLKYRKFFPMLVLFANNSFTLSGFNLFSIDMVHFRGIMMIAYRLFTFLQTRGNKNFR